jgi:hypothetical protein
VHCTCHAIVSILVSPGRATDYDGLVLLVPKLTVAPSSTIPTADPRPLFWVTGVVLGLLALWVLYVLMTAETRKTEASAPKPSGDGAE